MAPEDREKAAKFITYLFNSPQIKGENFITAESMIHAFISQNRDQLRSTFRNSQYFPHLEGDEAISIVVTELYNMVKDHIFKPLLPFVNGTDFSCIGKLAGQQLPPAFIHDKISDLTDMLIKSREVRSGFISAYNLFETEAIDRYINEIFKRRDFIYNELVRVQKTYLEAGEYLIFIKLLIILKHAAMIKIPLSDNAPDYKYTLTDILKMPGKLDEYIVQLTKVINKTAHIIPPRMIQLAVKANLPDTMTEVDEGSSRLLFILSARFHSYKPLAKVDRGAESPDKSWFAIAKKNSKIFGFDRNMLDELYRISGDNNW